MGIEHLRPHLSPSGAGLVIAFAHLPTATRLELFRTSPATRNFRGGRFGPPRGERSRGGFVVGSALRGGCGDGNEFWRARFPVRPVALQDEIIDARARGREIDLGDGDGAVAQSVADDEKIVAARFVESDSLMPTARLCRVAAVRPRACSDERGIIENGFTELAGTRAADRPV